jgi:hypothetical protein
VAARRRRALTLRGMLEIRERVRDILLEIKFREILQSIHKILLALGLALVLMRGAIASKMGLRSGQVVYKRWTTGRPRCSNCSGRGYMYPQGNVYLR